MHYTALTLLALSAAAIAAPNPEIERRQQNVDPSIVQVLLTAMPASLISLYLTNAPSASAVVQSELEAGGSTTGWFASLPSDVQSYLYAQAPTATSVPTSASAAVTSDLTTITSAPIVGAGPSAGIINSANGTVVVNATASSIFSSALVANASTGGAVTSRLSTRTATTSAGAATESATDASATASETGAAAVPSAVIGAGLAGALGFIGMLAL